MMIRALAYPMMCLSFLLLVSCQRTAEPSTVFCASSMTYFIGDLNGQTGRSLRIHSAGSNTLIRQLGSGIRADLIILADPELSGELPEAQTWTRKDFASNRLVLVASLSRSDLSLAEVLNNPNLRLALADPISAPLGRYSAQVRKELGIPGRPLLFRNASETLNAVAQGHADVGIIYKSDLRTTSLVRTVSEIPSENHATIKYVACLAPSASQAAKALFSELSSKPSQTLLKEAGFLTLERQAGHSEPK